MSLIEEMRMEFRSTHPPVRSGRFQRGFSFLSIVVVLAIAGALYMGYFSQMASDTAPVQATKQASQGMACSMNRRSVERSITTWEVTHPNQPLTLEALAQSGVTILPCPDGGVFRLEGRKVLCSLHP